MSENAMSEDGMSEDRDMTMQETSSEELAQILARRGKKGRARSTTVLIAVLLLLFGVLIGVPLGRATAPTDGPAGTSERGPLGGGPARGGPFANND
jgi:hypothetical protein